MDSAIFMEQSTAINKKVVDLRTARHKMLDADEDETTSETEYIIEILNDGPDTLAEFDATIFDNIIKSIIAVSRNELKFILINGLELTEYLGTEELKCLSSETSPTATELQTVKS